MKNIEKEMGNMKSAESTDDKDTEQKAAGDGFGDLSGMFKDFEKASKDVKGGAAAGGQGNQ
jgi:hypothetical protein